MKIICVTGLIGSGKDTAARHISKKGYHMLVLSNILRGILASKGIRPSRENLTRLQASYPKDFVGKECLKLIKNHGWRKVVVDGLRRTDDHAVLKKEFGKEMVVLVLNVDQKTRFERLRARARTGDPKTFGQFKKQEESEHRHFDYQKLFRQADFRVSNNGTLEELHEQIDEVLEKLN